MTFGCHSELPQATGMGLPVLAQGAWCELFFFLFFFYEGEV